jgi:hypothetical protein
MKYTILTLILLHATQIFGQDSGDSTFSSTGIKPTLIWAAAQLIPSPEWYVNTDNSSDFGLRWQVTPLLFSFGLNPHVSHWRTLVAEPLARYSGSVELYATPEYVPDLEDNWIFRSGIRTYFPVYQYGEYVATSLGVSYYNHAREDGVSYEAGIYIFFGIIGLQVSHSPGSDRSEWLFIINLRYF